jgi:hypothetical protein
MTRLRSFLIFVLLGTVLTLASITSASPPTLDRTEIVDLFSQGKQLFHQANELVAKDPTKARDLYRKATMRFERIAREGGIHNGELYYNIGNAYFRMQDLGRAILYYRQAQCFIPDDLNLRQNLSYARTKCADKIPEKQETKVLQTLFFWHYDLATKTRAVIFGLSFFIFWTVASVRLFVKKKTLNWVLIASAAPALIFLGSLLTEAWVNSRHIPGVVLVAEVVARKGDGETYQPSFSEPLHAGTEFDLLENRGEWYHIELPDGRSCWLPAKTVGLIK